MRKIEREIKPPKMMFLTKEQSLEYAKIAQDYKAEKIQAKIKK